MNRLRLRPKTHILWKEGCRYNSLETLVHLVLWEHHRHKNFPSLPTRIDLEIQLSFYERVVDS